MPTVEGKEARVWIDAYVKQAGKLSGVAKAVRTLEEGRGRMRGVRQSVEVPHI